MRVLIVQRFLTILYFINLFPAYTYSHSTVTKNEDFLFTENKGQWPEQVKYVVSLKNQQVFFEDSGIKIHEYTSIPAHSSYGDAPNVSHEHHTSKPDAPYKHHVYQIDYGLQLSEVQFQPLFKSSFYKNYIKGASSSSWHDHVYSYKELLITNVYPQIDMHWYTTERGLKFDWIINPGGNAKDIHVTYEYLEGLILDKKGNLILKHSLGSTHESAPVAQQCLDGKETKIDAKYILLDDYTVGMELGTYDPSEKLIIDPELIFSSYSGSTGDNWGSTATPGLNGELYGGGIVFGLGYPVTNGAFQTEPGDPNALTTDIAISKFSPDGTNLIYSTYLGGRLDELAHSLIENSKGELVVFGTSGSSDYPTTRDAVQSNFKGGPETRAPGVSYPNGCDIVVSVLSADGSTLVGSTYLGGGNTDGLNDGVLSINYGDEAKGEVFLDQQDNIFVAASTRSTDFPVKNALYNRLAGKQDACIFSLNGSCDELFFSTYFGGQQEDVAYCIKVTSNQQIIVGGGTRSRNLPAVNAYQASYGGGLSDGFFLLLDSMASNIISASYLGTEEYDQVYFNDLGPDRDIYFAGNTTGTLPQSSECYGRSNAGQFIQRFNQTGDSLKQSMGFGRGDELADLALTAFMVDDCGRAFLSGWGGYLNDTIDLVNSTTFDLDITADAYKSLTDGNDFYFMVLSPEMEQLTYATFFGADVEREPADHVDGGTSRFSEEGVVYQAVCASCGGGDVFPTTVGAWSRNNQSSNCNLAVVKLDFEIPRINLTASTSLDNLNCQQLSVDFLNSSTGADKYIWHFGDGASSNEYTTSHTYDSVGTYRVKLIAQSENECVDNDTVYMDINIDLGQETIYDTIIQCSERPLSIRSSFESNNPGISYVWNTGDRSPGIQVSSSGVYAVTTTDNHCKNIDSFYLEFLPPLGLSRDTSICHGDEILISIPLPYNVLEWSNDSTSREQRFSDTGVYWVSYEKSGCRFRDSFTVENVPQPEIQVYGTELICEGQSSILKSEVINGGPKDQLIWSNGSMADSIEVENSGVFSVLLNSNEPCYYSATDSIMVELVEDISQNRDFIVCDGEEVLLTGPPTAEEILWSNESRDSSISVSNTGEYFVDYSINGCPMRDSFNVFIVDSASFDFWLDGDGYICSGDSIELLVEGLLGSEDVFDIQWSTGDSSKQITVADGGTYKVTVSRTDLCPFQFRDEKTIQQIEPLDTVPDQVMCEGDSFSLVLNENIDAIVWYDNATSLERVFFERGKYGYEYQKEACTFQDEFQVDILPSPVLRIIGDSLVCGAESGRLEAAIQGDFDGEINWSNDETGPVIDFTEPGWYSAQVSLEGCRAVDSILVDIIPKLSEPVNIDTLLCGEERLIIDLTEAGAFSEVQWDDGYAGLVRILQRAGDFGYTVRNACEESYNTINVQYSGFASNERPLYIPNSFSPNGDGSNDLFKAQAPGDLTILAFKMMVFDRWGNKLFSSNDLHQGWDGRYEGSPLNTGVYVYVCQGEKLICGEPIPFLFKGDINLFR